MIIRLFFNFKKIYVFILLISLLNITSGCSDFRQAVGKEKYIPDEYVFVKTPKLTVPPGFGIDHDALKGNKSDQEDTLISLDVSNSKNEEFESLFDTKNIPKNIRKLVDEETLGIGLSERSGIDILFGQVPESGIVLDSEKESLRIKNSKKKSKSILFGSTPSFDINEQKKINIE